MTRVVHIYKGYDPPERGGIEKHIATLGRFLSDRDIDVEVLCSRPRGASQSELDGAVHVQRCRPIATIASTPLPLGLARQLRDSEADIIHVHYPWPPGEAAWLLAGRGRPLVVTVHCEVARYPRLARIIGPLSQRLLDRAQSILVSSPAIAAIPLLERHRDRVVVVPYGIDLERFTPDGTQPDPLPHLARPRVLFVGRLRHYKGLSVLAAALGKLPAVQLVVVGDGPERTRFEGRLRDAGASDRTHFQGEVPEQRLISLLRDADAAVLPSTSRAEAFGIAIVEAQACGTPAVTTDVGTGTTTTVENGRSGRVVQPGDADQLAAALEWCTSPDGLAERRTAARAHAVATFSADEMARATADVYRQALNSFRS